VQYGANQPEYDLIVGREEQLIKVSVKGSQDGSWGLTQSFLKEANYHGAIETWLSRHKPKTVLCFVQFQNVELDALPRVYLATPLEVSQRLRETVAGRGDTILYESHTFGPRAKAAGIAERIPESWRFGSARVEELLSHDFQPRSGDGS